jgi:hypothetical protein
VSFDDKATPENPPTDPRRARLWAVLPRLVLGAFAGGMLALSLTADPRGFWDGVMIGVGAQVLIRGVVALILRGRQDSLAGAVLSVAAGASVGAGVATLAASDHLVNLTIVGALVGAVDAVVSWVMFPTGNRTPAAPDEPPADADDDLRTADGDDEP